MKEGKHMASRRSKYAIKPGHYRKNIKGGKNEKRQFGRGSSRYRMA